MTVSYYINKSLYHLLNGKFVHNKQIGRISLSHDGPLILHIFTRSLLHSSNVQIEL